MHRICVVVCALAWQSLAWAQSASFGGEIRETWERFHNDFGSSPADTDGYLLQRYLLHADLHLGDHLRTFVELQSGLENGRVGGPRPVIDEDKLDVNQAFVEISFKRAVLRAGRQEIQLGSGRLLARREGTNTLMSFDGARLMLSTAAWHLDLFATRPVLINPGFFDDAPDHARGFWGVYATRRVPGGNIDVYYLGLDRKRATFDQGTARELRHTFGARFWGAAKAWSYDAESMYQSGRFGAGTISAWRIASDTYYDFKQVPLSPRAGLKFDVSSGDRNRANPDLQTFNALFQSGLYTGKAGLLGPDNTIDLEPSFGLRLRRDLSLKGGWGFYWRQSAQDGLYTVSGNLWRSGRLNENRYEGNRPIVEILWQVNKQLSVQSQFTYVFVGPFGHTPPYIADVSYVAAWVTYRF